MGVSCSSNNEQCPLSNDNGTCSSNGMECDNVRHIQSPPWEDVNGCVGHCVDARIQRYIRYMHNVTDNSHLKATAYVPDLIVLQFLTFQSISIIFKSFGPSAKAASAR